MKFPLNRGAFTDWHPPPSGTQDKVIYAWGRKANLAWFGIARWGST